MLKNIELFKDLSQEELKSLELFTQTRTLNPWEVLFHEWEDATSMYIVLSGTLQAYTDEKILWNITSQECIWEMSLFWDTKKRSANIKALEESKILILLDFSIKELSLKHPNIITSIKNIIEERKNKNT